jgi:hypothetical protein
MDATVNAVSSGRKSSAKQKSIADQLAANRAITIDNGWSLVAELDRLTLGPAAVRLTRGIGLTDKPHDGYDQGTLANDLVALMDALALSSSP